MTTVCCMIYLLKRNQEFSCASHIKQKVVLVGKWQVFRGDIDMEGFEHLDTLLVFLCYAPSTQPKVRKKELYIYK